MGGLCQDLNLCTSKRTCWPRGPFGWDLQDAVVLHFKPKHAQQELHWIGSLPGGLVCSFEIFAKAVRRKYSLVLFCREQFLEMYDSVMTAKIENYHLPITKMLRKFSLLCHTDKGCRAIPIVHFFNIIQGVGGSRTHVQKKVSFWRIWQSPSKKLPPNVQSEGGEGGSMAFWSCRNGITRDSQRSSVY